MGVNELFESRARVEIPNCVYSQYTECEDSATGKTDCYFDISIADQYGKHGSGSKNYVIIFPKAMVEANGPAEIVEKAIAALDIEIRLGRNIGLADSRPATQFPVG